MNILEMSVKGFRNLSEDTIVFDKGVNFIFGENAQGKTSLIEAIWMFTGARSFRGTKDFQLINFKDDFAKLDGKFFFENREQEITVCFAQGRRKAFWGGVAQKYPTNLIGKFRTVLFSPVHLALVKDGPENRRKFLDSAICQLKPTYTALIMRYNQTLRHRNALLKSVFNKKASSDDLAIWDEKLSELGAQVLNKRLCYMKDLQPVAEKTYSELSGGKEVFETAYTPLYFKKISFDTPIGEIKEALFFKLEKSRETDIKSGFTSVGPHKDEIDFSLDGKSAKIFGSQGQQRSVALSMKLAEAGVLQKSTNDAPVVLLDDVMSELDAGRQNYIMNKLSSWQVFITSCEKPDLKNFNAGKIFKLENGKTTTL